MMKIIKWLNNYYHYLFDAPSGSRRSVYQETSARFVPFLLLIIFLFFLVLAALNSYFREF